MVGAGVLYLFNYVTKIRQKYMNGYKFFVPYPSSQSDVW